jgi:fatty acid synthase subunit alpha
MVVPFKLPPSHHNTHFSAVAREIWERADNHVMKMYGFSILDIVRNNPTSRYFWSVMSFNYFCCFSFQTRTVHFGGARGAGIRARYMAMDYAVKGNKRMPLFPSVTLQSDSFTYRNPQGLLQATQFTQPALTLMELAAFSDMQANGLIKEDAPFAGHSLGEYAALAAVGNVLSIETLMDVVFYRGLTMSLAVPRKQDGSSSYGMVAVNPSRVSRQFSGSALSTLISIIEKLEGPDALLEIVNYNVENWQYVAAGSLRCLDVLQKVLDRIVADRVDLRALLGGGSGSSGGLLRAQSMPSSVAEKEAETIEMVKTFVLECAQRAKKGDSIVLERGHATIPLVGLDVPFHSTLLSMSFVEHFLICSH